MRLRSALAAASATAAATAPLHRRETARTISSWRISFGRHAARDGNCCRQFHVLLNGVAPEVERTPEDAGKSEHVLLIWFW